jgi:talin
MSVHEACKEIREKFGAASGGNDHGIFWPDTNKWLSPTKVLDFYEITSGDFVEFKKRHRMLKVKTLDDTVKTVLIDESVCDYVLFTHDFKFTNIKISYSYP